MNADLNAGAIGPASAAGIIIVVVIVVVIVIVVVVVARILPLTDLSFAVFVLIDEQIPRRFRQERQHQQLHRRRNRRERQQNWPQFLSAENLLQTE